MTRRREDPTLRDLTRLYLPVALLVVTALALLTPPFQVPDEQQHFFRAYQISEAHIRSTAQNGESGAVLPSSLIELSADFLGSRAIHTSQPVRPRPLADTLASLAHPLDPDRREFIGFTGAASYWPGAYLAQAVAIAIGRITGLGPLGLLYAARLLNAWTAVALIAAALRLIPTGRRPLVVVALLPMTLYEIASCSADAATIATSFLFTAIAASALATGQWRPASIASATAAALIFCPLKPVYAPLLLLAFPLGRKNASPSAPARSLLAHAIILAAAIGTTIAWLASSPVEAAAPFPNVDPAAQLRFLADHPFRFLHTITLTSEINALPWAEQMIGVLGWLSVHLPWPMLALPAALLLGCTLLQRSDPWRPDAPRAAWLIAIMLAGLSLILLALALLWSPVGDLVGGGAQGRYFIPLAAAGCILIDGLLPLLPASLARAITLLALAEAALTIRVVVRAFGLL